MRAFSQRLLLFTVILMLAPLDYSHADEINIYSYRKPNLLQPFLEKYTQKTGTKFNVVHAPKGLAQRLKSEGTNSPADIVLTTDVSRVHELDANNLLAPLNSTIIENTVPKHLIADDKTWTALSLRARVIVTSKERVPKNAITRIEDLARPEWRGRICSRQGSHVYNRALLASLVAHKGEAKAEEWAKAYVANLARRPQGNDRAQAKAIYAGQCDIALINTYYLGKMKNNHKEPEQKTWAENLNMIFFNQNDRGQHVNISAGGIVKTSKRHSQARKFLEWLVSTEAQKIYANTNYEYPINPDTQLDTTVDSWGASRGAFKADQIPISQIADKTPTAQMIIDRTGW